MRRIEQLAGVALLAALAAHAWTKGWPRLDEMLWLCHVASATLAVGLVVGRGRLVAAGFLLHVAWGAAMWTMDVVQTGVTTVTSVLVHALPLACGGLWLARHRWPRRTAVPAWAGFFALVPLSRFVTGRADNVNATYRVWPPFRGVVPGGLVGFWIAAGGLCLASMVVADWALAAWDRRRSP